MKKAFLFFTMLLFAFVGTMRADEVTIGDPTATTTNTYLPTYSLYEKSFTQQIYTADEIGMAGTINTFTMWLKNTSSYARNLNVYMKEIDETEFASTSAWVSMSDSDLVGSFTLANGISNPVETAVELTTPFDYTGNGNLVLCIQDVTGSWSGGAASVVMTTTEYQALYAYRDGTTYNPANPGVNGTRLKVKSVIKLDITPAGPGGALTTTPDVLDLGFRPNGAWMAPYVFTIDGTGTTVNALDFSGNYFTYNAQLPALITATRPLEVTVTTGEAEEGPVNSIMTVLFGGRDAQQFPVSAYAYDPIEGDVYETAIEVPTMDLRTPYSYVLPTENIYKNYDLPYETTDEDVVYKVTFDEDVLFYAGTEEGVVALYTEDFNGQDGPMADNNYVYEGPEIGPGPLTMWFSYDYTGTNTFFGSSAGGGTIFGYRITPEQIQELGLENCAITTVEAAAREGSYYDLVILKGGDTPDLNNMVYYQAFDNYEPFYFFDLDLDEPQFLGADENIWVMFFSDSPYAAYCGKQPVDVTNGKIWYTTNLSTWYSSTTYTPLIYTRFVELPTGREVTVNLADMKIRESKPAEGQIAEANGDVMNIAKAQMRSRDAQELTVYDGSATNSYVPVYGFYGDAYNKCEMVYAAAELSDMAGGTINSLTFYASTPAAEAWTGTFQVFLTEVADATISDFAGPGTVVYEGTLDGTQPTMTITFNTPYTYNGGNLLVGVYQTATGNYKSVTWAGETVTGASGSGYNYGGLSSCSFTQRNFVPKTTFSYTPAGGDDPNGGDDPTPYEPYEPTFECQIDGMYVPAGTYYVVATGNVLNMAIAEVPAPEIPYILYPYNGETSVSAPYLAEWVLGDYTTEMQVLVGTQYPPTTPLINWTSNLVEAAFLMDLEPNQSYFMQVKARNNAGTVESEIVAFITPLDFPTDLEVESAELYPGDAAVFTWAANRSFRGYNLYMYDGVEITKVNDDVITTNTYSVEDLAYNMDGYLFAVTAVYDAGESDYSEAVYVYMTGNGAVSGIVYEQPDEESEALPIAGATVVFVGTDEYGADQEFYVTAGEDGTFTGEILAGSYMAYVATEGYDAGEGVPVEVVYNETTEDIVLTVHEFYYPLSMITATEEENDVLVEWSWTPGEMVVDFETGDFSQANFVLPTTYPWAVTTTNPHEGTYCMKSTCEGIASGTSEVEVTVDVPYDGKMGFWVRVSSEANYDKFHFFIDGVEKGAAISGQQAYAYKEFDVTEGTHTYKWQYAKDSSVNSNDDCAYVDDITLYRYEAPLPPVVGATTYNFDDSSMMGWTSIDADGDGNGWVSSANPGIYHNSGVSLSGTGHDASEAYVISGSYANQTGQALTPDNYLVSPAQLSAENGAQIQFWACAQDASYAAEHFGVAVSTTTATAGAFTTIQEWTMSAKSTGATAEVEGGARGILQGTWYQYTVDLSAYAGQDIWVALRHFNCTDMFILNVDDITLATGGTKTAPRGDRSLVSYNLYLRDIQYGEELAEPELIMEGIASDVMSYVDNEWPNYTYGEYQWGIAATYEGYAPVPERSRETATFGFEGGSLDGWTNIIVNADGGEWIHSNNNLGGYDYTTLAHTGSGFAMCYSYVDYDGPYDTDAYFVSPQKYSVDANSSISFWADNANDSYPENFSVCVSTADTPTAASFTQVWSGGAKGTGNGGATVRRDENRYQNWRSHEISLAAYAGQEIWIAFHDVNYDAYEIWIDDVTINYAGGPTPGPTPGPTGAGMSEIIWSNMIAKDMNATLTFNVNLNNGQLSDGATVVANVGDETMYSATVEDGVAELVVRKGIEYTFVASLDGYTSESMTEFVEADAEYTVVLNEIIEPVSDLYVSPTGWAMWEGDIVTPTPGPGPQPGGGSTVTYDFENGLAGWTSLDADGDGNGWLLGSTLMSTGYGHNASQDLVLSQSYSNTSGALTPNNFLVSPEKAAYTQISFYACAQDNAWASEHFGVAVSTGAATASEFTTVQEWTMTAKEGPKGARGMNTQGNWYEYTVDLSSYAGQEIWVAIRHFNCTDWFYLDVDDITLTTAAKGNRAPLSYKVFLEGVYQGETIYPFYQLDVEGLVEGETYTAEVAPLYATGMGEAMAYEFTYAACDNYDGATEYAATVNGNDVTLTWTVNATPGPGPGPQPGGSVTYDFESGLDGWTSLDADGDGNGWLLGSTLMSTGYGHNGSQDLVLSQSYSNTSGALNPNNFLVSPSKAAYTAISFYACAQDNAWASEHFGVAVSTGAATASEFTTVQEWTMTAKEAKAPRGMNTQGTWYQYSVDLSSYAGQEIWVAIRHFNCTDWFYLDVDDITLTTAAKGGNDRAMWDLVYEFDGTSGYQYGVASDGQNIYTSSWSASSTSMFYKYDMQGNFIEEFNISGCGQLRGMTYDGQYFYGVANAATIYCVDLANHTLVSTTNSAYGAMRAITYDPERDGFWVVGNWSGNLTLVDRTGAIVQAGAAPTSASDVAYYKDADGVEHVYCFNNGTNDVDDYNIANNTITSAVFTVAGSGITGSSGGCFVGAYDDKTCFFADVQQSPQHIAIYELDSDPTPGPGPGPQPTPGNYLGVMVWRDGEPLTMAPITETTFVDEDVEEGEHDYAIRVVYSDYAMACEQVETVTVGGGTSCDPVTNLTAEPYTNQGNDGALVQFTEPAGATSYQVYVEGQLLGSIAAQPIFINFGDTPDGDYEIGIVAVYPDCESDMATVVFEWTAVAENEVVNAIYPNPTSSDLHINATAMTHVTVYNAMGQMVYDQEVSGDEVILNMGQYEAGVYMVKVTTETGSSVKRVNVVK